MSKERPGLQINLEADLSILEPNLKDNLEGEETVYKKVARRDLR